MGKRWRNNFVLLVAAPPPHVPQVIPEGWGTSRNSLRRVTVHPQEGGTGKIYPLVIPTEILVRIQSVDCRAMLKNTVVLF